MIQSLLWILQRGCGIREKKVPVTWQNRHWMEVMECFAQLNDSPTEIRWIPSHVDPLAGGDPYEDWWIKWNMRADSEAQRLNQLGHNRLDNLRRDLAAHCDEKVRRLRLLQKFYFKLAKEKTAALPLQRPTPLLPSPISSSAGALGDGWLTFLSTCSVEGKDPPRPFFRAVIEWIASHEIVG